MKKKIVIEIEEDKARVYFDSGTNTSFSGFLTGYNAKTLFTRDEVMEEVRRLFDEHKLI